MKITGEKYERMKMAMQAVYSHNPKVAEEAFVRGGLSMTVWTLWNIADQNLMNDDNHPFFKHRKWDRIVPYDPNWDVYSNDDDDSHIETALKRILVQIGFRPN